jgi:EAL domain-containing protein (putative c-di-GMP-specific phosphodiesterase class I)
MIDILNPENLDVYFQPIVDTKNMKVVGFESLIRGIDREKGEILSPKILFEKAKKYKVITEFDRLCRELAFKKYKEFGLDKDYFLYVNVSSEAVDSFSIGTDWIKRRLDYYGINPGLVVVEINEAKINITKNLLSVVKNYKEFGLNIAIDDFGTEHSNFDRLVYIDFNFLKLADVLIRDADKNERKLKVLEVMSFLAKKLDIYIIAEGIESLEEAKILSDLGIDYHQGFFYCKPISNPLEAINVVANILNKI